MDMGSSTMNMASMTMTMTSASSTATAAMSMSGMDMGGGCKISMLWNWYTIDACFLASSWHITSKGMFAGSCIGVILLVIALEFVRRTQREYDRSLAAAARSTSRKAGRVDSDADLSSTASSSKKGGAAATIAACSPGFGTAGAIARPTMVQQAIRSFFYMAQFAAAYMVMLLAMYFNGYIIISIFIGAFLGHFIWAWDNISLTGDKQETGTACC